MEQLNNTASFPAVSATEQSHCSSTTNYPYGSVLEPQLPFYGYNRGKGAASALIYSNTYRYQAKGPITDFHTFLGAKIHTFMGVEDRGHGGCSLGRVGVGVVAKPVLKKRNKTMFYLNIHVK